MGQEDPLEKGMAPTPGEFLPGESKGCPPLDRISPLSHTSPKGCVRQGFFELSVFYSTYQKKKVLFLLNFNPGNEEIQTGFGF